MPRRNLYRLVSDYTNPKPDRRRPNDVNSIPVIKKGTYFIQNIREDDRPEMWFVYPTGYQGPRYELIQALLPQLEKVEPSTYQEVLIRHTAHGGGADRFVRHLLETGAISLKQFDDFLNAKW